MNLKGIISVSGKPGLFKLVGQNKSGFILESLDAQKLKLVVNMSTSKMSSLEDITVFGDGEDIRLQEIFEKIGKSAAAPDPKADNNALRQFFREVAPGHDEDRVYTSDIKKIATWYNLLKDLPLFKEDAVESAPGAAALEEAIKKPEAVHAEKPKPVAKAAGKGATRLPRKAS